MDVSIRLLLLLLLLLLVRRTGIAHNCTLLSSPTCPCGAPSRARTSCADVKRQSGVLVLFSLHGPLKGSQLAFWPKKPTKKGEDLKAGFRLHGIDFNHRIASISVIKYILSMSRLSTNIPVVPKSLVILVVLPFLSLILVLSALLYGKPTASQMAFNTYFF